MRKKIVAAALAGAMIFGQAAAVFAAPVHLAMDGVFVEMQRELQLIDGRTMVDITEVDRLFGWLPWANEENGGIEQDGRYFVPIRYVADELNLKLEWDGRHSVVQLYTGGPVRSFIEAALPIRAGDEVSFDNAMRLINERDVQLSNMETARLTLTRERRAFNRDFEDVFWNRDRSSLGQAGDNYSRNMINMLIMREHFDAQAKTMDINERMLREGNEMQLWAAISSIQRTELDIVMLEAQIKIEERNIALVELLHELGLESDTSLRDANMSLERSKANLDGLSATLSDQRNTINNTIGPTISKKRPPRVST